MRLVESFKSKNESDITFRFLVTGVTALVTLVIIFVVFFCWYKWTRRQEKARRARQTESTFSERLASRSAARSCSKIDVGFASQTNLDSDSKEPKRRQTFSRFFQLWKGLRNSKRKSNSDETRRSVVFTIPTDEIFPKSSTITKQQTQRLRTEDNKHVVEINGFVTHLCADVHKINEYDNGRKNNLNQEVHIKIRENRLIGQTSDKELAEVNMKGTKKKTSRNENESTTQKTFSEIETTAHALSTYTGSLENNGQSDDDRNISKESDVENDSGFGSSCHEMPSAETQHEYLPLTVKTLDVSDDTIDNKPLKNHFRGSSKNKLSKNTVEHRLLAEHENSTNVDRCSHDQLTEPQVKEDMTFSALIQMAKGGMSREARNDCEHAEIKDVDARNVDLSSKPKRNTVTGDCLNMYHDGEVSMNNNVSKKHTRDSDIRNIRRQVKSMPRLNQTYDTEATEMDYICRNGVHSGVKRHDRDDAIRRSANFLATGDGSSRQGSNCSGLNKNENKIGEFHSGNLQMTKQGQVSFESLPADRKHSSAYSKKGNTLRFVETVHDTSTADHFDKEATTLSVPSLNVQNSLDDVGLENDGEKKEKERVVVERKNKVYLRVPSFENLQLPSQTSSSVEGKRVRSFSATIRRKFSSRTQSSCDDSEVQSCEQASTKTKKIKPFGSFRINKKSKSSSSDSRTSSLDNWLESGEVNGYACTFDKIFSEDTGGPVFNDVPFTIPEISSDY